LIQLFSLADDALTMNFNAKSVDHEGQVTLIAEPSLPFAFGMPTSAASRPSTWFSTARREGERAVRGYFRPGQRQSGPVIQSKSSYLRFAIRISGHTGAAFVAF